MATLDSGLVLLHRQEFPVSTIISHAERLVSRITGVVLLLVMVPMLLAFLVDLVTYLGSLMLASFSNTSLESCGTRFREQVQVMVNTRATHKTDARPVGFKALGQFTFRGFVKMTVSDDDHF